MIYREVNESFCNVPINKLLLIYKFGEDFVIGGKWHFLFYIKILIKKENSNGNL